MDSLQMENTIYLWINGILGLQAIFAYPDEDRPKTPYVLINSLSDVQKGTEESTSVLLPDTSTDKTYSAVAEVTFSVNTYYSGAYQQAINIKKSLMLVEVQDLLYSSGLGYLSSTQIQKIPELIDKRWEERAQFDIVFLVRYEAKENIETIKKIEVNNNTIGD
jgi:hypothetical protein